LNEFEARKFKNLFGVKEITNEEKKLITFTLGITLSELVPRKIKKLFDAQELKKKNLFKQRTFTSGTVLDLILLLMVIAETMLH